MRTLPVSLSVLMLVSAPAAAQSQGPQTYSLTMTMAGGLTVQVARDGTKESVEQTVAPGPNGPGMHVRSLYDFAAQKVWTLNLAGGPCSVVAYTSAGVPPMFDPVAGADEIRAELAKAKPPVLRNETVNGIATRVYEVPIPEIKSKMRMSIEDKHSFPVKMVIVSSDGKEQTQLEVTRLSFDKPSADLFIPPQNCQVQGGTTNASGGHVETTLGGQAPQPEPPAPGAAPQIEVRGAGVSPLTYEGPSPATYTFSFFLEATGPIEAPWVLVSQAGTAWASGKVVFDAAGGKDLNVPVKISVPNGKHWEGAGHLEVTVGGKKVSSVKVEIFADAKAK